MNAQVIPTDINNILETILSFYLNKLYPNMKKNHNFAFTEIKVFTKLKRKKKTFHPKCCMFIIKLVGYCNSSRYSKTNYSVKETYCLCRPS